MNIFATYADPRASALALDNKRLIKMTLETGQIICTARHLNGFKDAPYKIAHQHHPVCKWAAASIDNLMWLVQHFRALNREYCWRYDKEDPHATMIALQDLVDHLIAKHKNTTRQPKAFQNSARHQGLGIDFSHMPTHEAYRAYLNARWDADKRPPVWGRRRAPSWRT